jgi:CheY-like chemotaxis protein
MPGGRAIMVIMNQRPIEILLVEDSPADVRLTQEALKTTPFSYNMQVAEDGEIAMAMLRREQGFLDSTRPDLILLDLNLPNMDGRQVLAEVKADSVLGIIPVVVLSTSQAPEDVIYSYQRHANGYIRKPVGMTDFVIAINGLMNYWGNISILPTRQLF